jgi:hypothetical protein
MKILLTVLLLSSLIAAQNTYSVQPGVKNNQIVLQLSNVSETEQASLPKPLPKGPSLRSDFKHLKFVDNIEETIILNPKETKELIFTFDVEYNIGKTEADTIEFVITDNKSINITKQFILQYTSPTEYKLEQNYPNPFNPTTKIRYAVSQDVRSEKQEVSLKVYDILGNEVTTLVNEQKDPGYYEIDFNAHNLPAGRQGLASGVYIYRLTAGSFISTKKMMVLK